MKRFIISLSVLLIASLGLMIVFAEAAVSPSQLVPEPNQPTVSAEAKPNKTTTAPEPNTIADILADPNKIESAIKEFEGLDKELAELKKEGVDEMRQWFSKEADSRTALAKAAHENATEEIMFIRKLAVEEGAKKTTAAIDGLLLSRQERYDKLIVRLQEEKKELRRTRTTRDRYRPGQRYPQDRRTRGQQSEEATGQNY